MNTGAVGGIRNIKDAISVARKVMEKTRYSLLGGSLATDFAVQMGFKKESLQDDRSYDVWQKWKSNDCQPNFWEVCNFSLLFIIFYCLINRIIIDN